MPRFGGIAGRTLTSEERRILLENTEALIHRFEDEERQRLEAQEAAEHERRRIAEIEDQKMREQIAARRSYGRLPNRARTTKEREPEFTKEQRRAAEPEARKSLAEQFGDIDLDSAGWNGLLQMEIDKILRRMP